MDLLWAVFSGIAVAVAYWLGRRDGRKLPAYKPGDLWKHPNAQPIRTKRDETVD